MATGMIFAALAFVAATLVEINVVKTVVDPAPAGKCLLQVVNLVQGDISVKIPNNDIFPDTFAYLQDPPKYEMLELETSRTDLNIEVSFSGSKVVCQETFEEQKAHSLIIYKVDTLLQCMVVEDNIQKNTDGKPFVRFFSTLQEAMNITIGEVNFYAPPGYRMSSNDTVDRREYPSVPCDLQSEDCPDLNLGLLDFGASYTFILMKESGKIVAEKMEDVKANSVHIAWQVPQYVLLTAGEVMFSITGLEFSYSQAPSNMKSVLQAGWLLTVAFGNVIVLIVAEGAGLEQWKEFVLFAGLLLGVCIIFSIMSIFYKYVDPEGMDKMNLEDSKEEDETDEKKSSMKLNKSAKSTRM